MRGGRGEIIRGHYTCMVGVMVRNIADQFLPLTSAPNPPLLPPFIFMHGKFVEKVEKIASFSDTSH